MAFIRGQVEKGEPLDREAIEDLMGHNDHLTQLCEARARLLLYSESDIEALRKDADRWRFVRNPLGNQSPFAVWSERTNLFLGKFADEAIDAAMIQIMQPLNPA